MNEVSQSKDATRQELMQIPVFTAEEIDRGLGLAFRTGYYRNHGVIIFYVGGDLYKILAD